MTTHSAFADHWHAVLMRDGYCIIPGVMPASEVAGLYADLAPQFNATPFCEGDFYGWRTKRFGRLLLRSPRVARFVQQDLVLAITGRVLSAGCDVMQLNVAQAIAVHPGSRQQVPHRDQDMWRLTPGDTEHLVNVIWPFVAFTETNGATRVWPHTHGRSPRPAAENAEPVTAAMQPGDALLFLGSTLHGAGPNRDGGVRASMVIGYSAGWLKPYENPWLAYPPEVAREFAPALAALVGYQQHRPNLGNFEGQCPSVLLRGEGSKPLPAIDALRPDQIAAVAEYAARQAFTM